MVAAGAAGWCASSSGLFSVPPEEDRATGEEEEVRQFPAEALRSGLVQSSVPGGAPRRLLLALLAGLRGTPVAFAMSPSILALIFSLFAFHSSKKSAGAFDLNPPVAMILLLLRKLVKLKLNSMQTSRSGQPS